MSKIRRNFSKEFKKKVVLEALKERSTLEALAKKYELQPTQISLWKAQALSNFEFYNKVRLHQSLDYKTPYAKHYQTKEVA